MSSPAAFVAGDALPRIAAVKKPLNRMSDDASVISVVLRIEALIIGLKILEMRMNDLKERALVKAPCSVRR
jgi:hypothetical protein